MASSTRAAAAVRRRRIAVAVDESDESMNALSWCLANVVSSSSGAAEDALVRLHARRPSPVYAELPWIAQVRYMMTSNVLATMERHADAVSAAAVDKAKHICAAFPHVKVDTVVESGDTRDVICDAVDEMDADLLVMGSHEPWIWTPPEGIPGQRKQPLCAKLQMPSSDCQEAERVIQY